jgi:hypothetical protein
MDALRHRVPALIATFRGKAHTQTIELSGRCWRRGIINKILRLYLNEFSSDSTTARIPIFSIS